MTNDDLIRRKSAIDGFYEMASNLDYLCTDSDYINFLEALPSAQSERKGEWVKAFDGYDGHVKCNKCFKTYDWTREAQYFDYCPHCGCRMIGEDNG